MSSETASTRWTRKRIVSLTKGVGWPLSKTGIHTTKDFGMNYQGKKKAKARHEEEPVEKHDCPLG